MAPRQDDEMTQRLLALSRSPARAWDQLVPVVYDELHRVAERVMRRERPDHTLQPTALLHEAFVRLIDQTQVRFTDRVHFFRLAARVMRQVLVDHARRRHAGKRDATRRSPRQPPGSTRTQRVRPP